MNFLRVDSNAVIHGVVLDDWTPPPNHPPSARRAFKRQRRDNPDSTLDSATLATLASGLRQCLREQVDVAERATVDSLRVQYAERNFEDWAREEIRRATQGLSAALIHDQLQYLATIYQNTDHCNVRSGRMEKAILVTCELLSERQKAARLLVEDAPLLSDEWSPRRPHTLFTKLMRLYDTKMHERGVKMSIDANWMKCTIPGDLAMVAALAIVDNAVKYAPENSHIWIKFEESEESVVAIVDSLGPRIEANERPLLGTAAFRGQHAAARGVAGSGIGLWQAKLAARDWGALEIRQDETESSSFPGYYRTQALLTFYRNASRERLSSRNVMAASGRPPGQ